MLNNDAPGMHVPHPLAVNPTQPYGFYTYLPIDYIENGDKYPLLVFLHGVGERGDNLQSPQILKNVLRNGPPKIINLKKWSNKHSMIVVSPQCHETRWFPEHIHQLFQFILQNYNIDEGAIFLTGLSMGGFGTFHYLEQYHKEKIVKAAIAVCGGGNPANAHQINIPVWAFHGDDDQIVPSIYSKEMIKAINAANPKVRSKLTIYPKVEHDSWTMTYDGSGMGKESTKYDPYDENLYEWMLKFRDQ